MTQTVFASVLAGPEVGPRVFFGAAALMVVIGLLCLRNTSPFTLSGVKEYEAKQRRRIAGFCLIAAAVVPFMTGRIVRQHPQEELPAASPSVLTNTDAEEVEKAPAVPALSEVVPASTNTPVVPLQPAPALSQQGDP